MGVKKRHLQFTRDGVLFVTGLMGIGYETLIEKIDRPTLLILFGGMIGLPAFLKKDTEHREGGHDESSPSSESEKKES